MLDDIKNSIKAKLYDFTYTPFMSSVVVSWIILNHKYLLIYFGDAPLEQKLVVLNAYNFSCPLTNMVIPYAMNIWFPIVFGLFYVFVYPLITERFYEYTLEKTKKLKEIKQKIEDETPITQEEARKITKEIDRLIEVRDDALNKLSRKEEEYKKKLEPITEELYSSKKSIESLIAENKSLRHQLTEVNQSLSEKNEGENIKKEKVSNLDEDQVEFVAKSVKTKVPKEILPKPKNQDREQILEYLYKSYETSYENNLLDKIVNTTNMPRAKARKIINELVEEGILEKDSINQVSITKNGGETLVNIFDKK